MSTQNALVAAMSNGEALDEAAAARAVALDDRGLQYGDGVFETMLLRAGAIRFLSDHLERLHAGCARLAIDAPDFHTLQRDVHLITAANDSGVLKLTVTRGRGRRGYRPSADAQPSRFLSLYGPPEASGNEVTACWCKTRLARNAQLAGIKHLNRLEQVLAQAEWSDADIGEGLMLDTEGELVSGTSSNLFLVIDGSLVTPDLRYSGVHGVMRKNVLAAAARLGVTAEERAVWPVELSSASEVFVTNALRGLRAVRSLGEHRWELGPVARALITELNLL